MLFLPKNKKLKKCEDVIFDQKKKLEKNVKMLFLTKKN